MSQTYLALPEKYLAPLQYLVWLRACSGYVEMLTLEDNTEERIDNINRQKRGRHAVTCMHRQKF